MVAFLYRMGSGIPGNVNRIQSAIITAEKVLTTNPPTRYGDPVVLDAATQAIRPFGAGDTAANFYGFIVRPFPTQGAATGWPNQGFEYLGTPGVPAPYGVCNVLKAGYIDVCVDGPSLAVKGLPLWVRVGGATALQPIGGIEAVVDPVTPANTISLPYTFFMGPQDANQNSEVYVWAGNK